MTDTAEVESLIVSPIAKLSLLTVESQTPERPKPRRRKKRRPLNVASKEIDVSAEGQVAKQQPGPWRRFRKPKIVDAAVIDETPKGNILPQNLLPISTSGTAQVSNIIPKRRRRNRRRTRKQTVKNNEDTNASGDAERQQHSAKDESPGEEIAEGTRAFGLFHCVQCPRSWSSGNAWKGKKQNCRECGISLEATKLRRLHRRRAPTRRTTSKSMESNDSSIAAEGIGANGTAVNGTAVNGTAVNGTAANGTAAEGMTTGKTQIIDTCVEVLPPLPNRKPHPCELCEMCKELGHNCRQRPQSSKRLDSDCRQGRQQHSPKKRQNDNNHAAQEIVNLSPTLNDESIALDTSIVPPKSS